MSLAPANTCTVEPVCAANEQEYAAYLLESSSTLLYSSLAYRDLLADYLGAQPRFLLARDATSRVVGSLAAMLSRPGPLGPVLNSMPYYGSNGGAVVRPDFPAARLALLEAFHEVAEAEHCAAATIVTSPLEHDTSAYDHDARFTLRDERVGLLTPLPDAATDVEAMLLASFEAPRPRNIRRAQKSNVRVEVTEALADWRFLHETHKQNMHAVGGRSKTWAFFEHVRRHIPREMRRLYLARVGDASVAALLVFYGNRTAEYFTPATNEAWRSAQPMSLVIFRAMADAARAGLRQWNWGGTWLTQAGVYDFKRRWGTIEHRYHYYTRILDSRVLEWRADALLEEYPHFFVAPFGQLSPAIP